MNTQNTSFHQQRLIFVIVAAIGAIAAFLAWVSFNVWGMSQSISGFDLEHAGKITLLLFVAIIVLCCLGDRSVSLNKNSLIGVTVLGTIAALIPIYVTLTINSKISEFGGGEGDIAGNFVSDLTEGLSNMISYSLGYWLTLLAGLVVAGLAGFTFYKERNGQGLDINIDTEKIGKAFATGASVVKAAGTAATQAVKDTIESQKNDNQTAQTPQEPVFSEATQEPSVEPTPNPQTPSDNQTPDA